MRFLTTVMRGIFDSLQGSWAFERTLESLSGVTLASVTGGARFSPQTKNVYHYQEEGELTDALQKQLKVHKEYLYCYQQETNIIEKHFSEDGHDRGLFYQLNFNPLGVNAPLRTAETLVVAHGEHLCSSDLYRATLRYYYNNQNALTKMDLEYEVSGPEKSYVAKTVFRR